jgi:hypothetical protein
MLPFVVALCDFEFYYQVGSLGCTKKRVPYLGCEQAGACLLTPQIRGSTMANPNDPPGTDYSITHAGARVA